MLAPKSDNPYNSKIAELNMKRSTAERRGDTDRVSSLREEIKRLKKRASKWEDTHTAFPSGKRVNYSPAKGSKEKPTWERK